jgi:hypothetical protein
MPRETFDFLFSGLVAVGQQVHVGGPSSYDEKDQRDCYQHDCYAEDHIRFSPLESLHQVGVHRVHNHAADAGAGKCHAHRDSTFPLEPVCDQERDRNHGRRRQSQADDGEQQIEVFQPGGRAE